MGYRDLVLLNSLYGKTDILYRTPAEFRRKEYHRSFYTDLGLNVKLINRAADWSIGAGGAYQIGAEKYVSEAGWRGDQLDFYRAEKTNSSRFGIFVKNTVEFGEVVSLNLTVYRFNFWAEYMSFGPSFKIR